ncbi:DUF7003 family protein [Chitinophaga lutea]
MKFSAADILRSLDEAAAALEFPMLDNGYLFPGDAQLTLFRDEARWAVLFEVIAWHNQATTLDEALLSIAYLAGNCVEGEKVGFFQFAAEAGQPVLSREHEDGIPRLDPAAGHIRLRDTVIPLIHDPNIYLQKGILPSPEGIAGWELMRSLLPEYAWLMRPTREELADRLPVDIPALMTLAYWEHPDLAEGGRPSDTEAFRQLAAVLATGDTALYRPTIPPNSHWRHWPQGGML